MRSMWLDGGVTANDDIAACICAAVDGAAACSATSRASPACCTPAPNRLAAPSDDAHGPPEAQDAQQAPSEVGR